MSNKYNYSSVFGTGNFSAEENSKRAFNEYTKIFNIGVKSIDGDDLSAENVYDAILLLQDLSKIHNARGGLSKIFGGGNKEGKMIEMIKNNLQGKGIDKKIMQDILSNNQEVIERAMNIIKDKYPVKIEEKKEIKIEKLKLQIQDQEEEIETAIFKGNKSDYQEENVVYNDNEEDLKSIISPETKQEIFENIDEEEGTQFEDYEENNDEQDFVDEELEESRKVKEDKIINEDVFYYNDEEDDLQKLNHNLQQNQEENQDFIEQEDEESEEKLRELEIEDEENK